MGTVPQKQNEAIVFFQQRMQAWSADPPAIGLTPETVAEVEEATQAARAALTAAQEAELAYRNAVMLKDQALETMRSKGGGAINLIRAFAQGPGGEAVYGEAMIPPRSAPSPVPAPEMPENLKATLQNDGSTQIRWSAKRSGGVVFTIQRRLEMADGSVAPWATIATSTDQQFTDATLPAGVCSATYQTQAVRGSKVSEWSEPVMVRFSVTDPAGETHGSDDGLALAA